MTAEDVWVEPASAAHARTTYYEQPVLKEPVWIWAVPAYFYAGGVAGAAAVTGAAIQVAGRGSMRDLMKKCRVVAAAGTAVGTGLLIYDLGRPARFLNMLRVFRPTSVLNMGSWILGAATSSSAGALLLRAGRSGISPGSLRGLPDFLCPATPRSFLRTPPCRCGKRRAGRSQFCSLLPRCRAQLRCWKRPTSTTRNSES